LATWQYYLVGRINLHYYVVFLLKVSVGGKAYCLREGKGDLRVAFLFISSLFSWRDRCD